jgi:hypothetical protein
MACDAVIRWFAQELPISKTFCFVEKYVFLKNCKVFTFSLCPGGWSSLPRYRGTVGHFEIKIMKLPMKYWSQLALKDICGQHPPLSFCTSFIAPRKRKFVTHCAPSSPTWVPLSTVPWDKYYTRTTRPISNLCHTCNTGIKVEGVFEINDHNHSSACVIHLKRQEHFNKLANQPSKHQSFA